MSHVIISRFFVTICITLKYFSSVEVSAFSHSQLVSLLQRRCSLEDWMEKLLSDIDVSRSVQIAMFLELEAAVRSCRCFLVASWE